MLLVSWIEWVVESWFVHTTVPPGRIRTGVGAKAKPAMATGVVDGALAGAAVTGVVAAGWAACDMCMVGVGVGAVVGVVAVVAVSTAPALTVDGVLVAGALSGDS